MHRFEFQKRAEKTLKNTLNLLLNKSRDYAPETDVYNGMMTCERLGICTLEKGILVRMTDKIGRLSNLIDGIKTVHNESTLDTVRDILGYACLLHVYMEKNNEEAAKQEKAKEHETMVDNALRMYDTPYESTYDAAPSEYNPNEVPDEI